MNRQNKTKTELIREIQLLEERVEFLEKIETALNESENRFRLFSETSFEGIVLSENGVFVDFNDQFSNMVGYTRSELLGKSVMFIIDPESQGLVKDAILTNRMTPFKIFGLHKDGRKIHAEVMARSLDTENRKLRATAIRDITEQERIQSALRLSEKKFSTAFYASPDSININRLSDGLYLEVNQGFTNIMGYTAEDVVGKTSLELDIWADPEDRAKLVEVLREHGEITNLEAKFQMKNEDYRIGLMSAKIMECDKEPCLLSVTRDITEWKETQKKIEVLNNELLTAYDETLEGWSRALNLRDSNTDAHSRRVVDLTINLAKRIDFPEAELVYLRRGAILHDIGKMGVPDYILLKPGSLTDKEWEIMRLHPVFAYEMLSAIPFLERSLEIPYCHHEKWDGTGYPRKLKGTQIPLPARIFSIIDVFDALTSDRPYRPAWRKNKALAYIQEKAGSFFDPDIVECFFELEQNTPSN